ncbi:MAG TPA: sigma factor-like helix-turn-helix DNA-binding protein [Myxococcales bacterium]
MPDERPLSQLLFALLERADEDPELEPALTDILENARASWPSVALDDQAFLVDLAAHLPAGERLSQAVRAMHVSDLYLACACKRGDAKALGEFERRVLVEARAALLARRQAASTVEEALQQLRSRLFVGEEGKPGKIAEYSGRGPLVAWVRMAAVRVSQNLSRGGAARPAEELQSSQLAAPAAPPELGYIKARYRGDFKAAFEAAFGALSPRERTLLRLNLLDGLSTAKLAKVYRADASTVRRWLADARRALLEGTRKQLASRLDASEREMQSMMDLLVTQLEDSVRRILGEGRGG